MFHNIFHMIHDQNHQVDHQSEDVVSQFDILAPSISAADSRSIVLEYLVYMSDLLVMLCSSESVIVSILVPGGHIIV